MSHTATRKTPRPSSSQANELHIAAPKKWKDLTQEQLRYVLTLLSLYEPTAAKTYMLMRFCKIKVVGLTRGGYRCVYGEGRDKRAVYIQPWQIASLLSQLNFVEKYEEYDVRLERIGGRTARDPLLHGVSFLDYANAEKCFQLYARTRETRHIDRLLDILYPDDSGKASPQAYTDAERINAQYWFAHVREVFNSVFSHLFRPDHTATADDYNPVAIINAQVRILTGGDITKEDAVFQKDCWRALFELDAQAKEAADMKREMAKHKS